MIISPLWIKYGGKTAYHTPLLKILDTPLLLVRFVSVNRKQGGHLCHISALDREMAL